MTPRADEYECEDLSASEDDDDDDDDEGLKEDMAALSRACMIAAADPADFTDLSAPTTTEGDRDLSGAAIHSAPDVQDPLLDAGDIVIPMAADSDDEGSDLEYLKRVQNLYQPLSSLPPLPPLPPPASDDEEDDIETLRAILKRFSAYEQGAHEGSMEKLAEGDLASSLACKGDIANCLDSYKSEAGELCPVSQDLSKAANSLNGKNEMQPCGFIESYNPDACKLSKLPQKRSFPLSAQVFIDAITKNRSFQRFLRSKLIEVEAKIEENKRLRDKVKILKDLQASCTRTMGNALSQKKNPLVQLISARKSSASNNSKSHNKKISAMCYGPAKDSHVANYRMVLERFPVSFDRKKWSNAERENLAKGIKQQFQEMVLQISVDRISSEFSSGDANDLDSILESIKDLEITPERIREFLPKVNWDQLASMYVVGRTGAECEARWLNCEDPLINHGPWTHEEDKFLLCIVQDMGIRNWFDIAVSLATNRTPFQCLARYQRSLNPCMLNSEWTEEEDAQLCSAVAIYGESNWQDVASDLERRTGSQCSNRWKKSLCPERKGSFSPEEDEHLTVAVMLFGRKWNQIAKFVSGRTQSQCRDRYINSLDPSLKWGGWTEEEDSRLKAAIAKHGYCWSKVAKDVPPRTDSQCRKRWKVLCPDQVPLLQAARKTQKAALVCNFVDRESERPALSLNDFLPLTMLDPPFDADDANLPRKQKRKPSNGPEKMQSKRHAKKAKVHPKEDDVHMTKITEPRLEKDNYIKFSNIPKKLGSERLAKRTKVHPKEVGVHMTKITETHLEKDNLVETDGQVDLGGHDKSEKLLDLNPIGNGHTEPDLENQSCISPCENPESGATNGHYTEGNCGNCTVERRTCKHHCERKLSAKDSSEHSRSQGSSGSLSLSLTNGEVLGSSFARTTVSKKENKKNGKLNRNMGGAEPSANELDKMKMSKPGSLSTCLGSLESQGGDDLTLACFLRNKSKKRQLKCSKNVSQASFSSMTTVVSEPLSSKQQVENQIPSSVQDGLSQTCSSGTNDLFTKQNVASHGQVRKPEDVNMSINDDDDDDDDGDVTLACFLGNKSKSGTNDPFTTQQNIVPHGEMRKPENVNKSTDDDGDVTLACFLGNKSKKWTQAAKGPQACSSSKLKKKIRCTS